MNSLTLIIVVQFHILDSSIVPIIHLRVVHCFIYSALRSPISNCCIII